MSKKRVLITGGAGFIGSNLCRALLDDGNEVTCLDDLSSGSYGNIEDLMGRDGFSFVRHDVCEPFDIDADEIYHLACPASPIIYQERPVDTLRTCILGALNVLALAGKKGARVLLASTSEVYGDPLVHPQSEDYRGNVSCTGPRACYDEGKRVSEALFFDHKRQYDTDICVIRIFNTYGPLMAPDDGRVIPNFICQALSGSDLTIYGDGSQTRSICFISDLIRGLTAVMSKKEIKGPVNLGNPAEMSVKELAERIIRLTGSSSGIVYCDLPEDDPVRRRPDITLAENELGWSPEVDPEDGLKITIDYFRKYFDDDKQQLL